MSQQDLLQCHVCGKAELRLFDKMKHLPRAASDCRPWREGGEIGVCRYCGIVQKVVNEGWKKEAAEIYSVYDLYHQSMDGAEQVSFDASSGESRPRSRKIIESLQSKLLCFPEAGRMIDVGCGTGGFLSSFSAVCTGWELNGFEPNVKDPARLFSIPGVKEIYSLTVDDLPGVFNFISIIHALEHIDHPISFLESIKRKLAPNGLLLVQVPYFCDNPFDLIIADHCTHFTLSSLAALMGASGFEIVYNSSDVIQKEITLLAKPSSTCFKLRDIGEQAGRIEKGVGYCLDWLSSVVDDAATLAASSSSFGIFGTSIAANWMLGALGDKISFFVDEDQGRVGRTYRERPVYAPQDIPDNSDVFVPLSRQVANFIVERNKRPGVRFKLPPVFSCLVDNIA